MVILIFNEERFSAIKKSQFSIFIYILAFILLFLCAYRTEFQAKDYLSTSHAYTVSKTPLGRPVTTVRIAAVGDFLMHIPVVNAAYNPTNGEYDFSPMFKDVQRYLSDADLTVANLETTLAGGDIGYSGYPLFNSPVELAHDMKSIGIDIVTTANNHCLDQGEKGLLKTIQHLEQAGLDYVGTSKKADARGHPLVKDAKGVKIGFLSYTQTTNGNPVPPGKGYLVNLIDPILIKKDVEKLKENSVDIIVVCLHFGSEYQRHPNDYQRKLVNMLFEMGVNIILGSHPHVVQPVEFYPQENKFVIYSLGNFISNQRWRYSDCGIILNLIIKKNLGTGRVHIKEVNYIPVWVDTFFKNNILQYRVLPVQKAIYNYENGLDSLLTEKDYKKLVEIWLDLTGHLNQSEQCILPKDLLK